MTFTPFTIETLRSLTLNEIFMGRIKLATRSCFWIDPLVKPIRLAALKRIAYDKPIRKQLVQSKLVQSNDNHMNLLERTAVEAQLIDSVTTHPEEPKAEPVIETPKSEPIIESVKSEPTVKTEPIVEKDKSEEIIEDFAPQFKPFVNRIGQLIINPVGRSKEFFSKHNQQVYSDFVKPKTSQLNNNSEQELTSQSMISETKVNRPQSIPVSNVANIQHSKESSPFQPLITNSSQKSTSTTPSETEPSKMTQIQTKTEQQAEENDEIFQVSYLLIKLYMYISQIFDEKIFFSMIIFVFLLGKSIMNLLMNIRNIFSLFLVLVQFRQ